MDVEAGDPGAVQYRSVACDALGAQEPRCVGVYFARDAGIESLALAQAGHHDTPGRDASERVDQGKLALFASDVAFGDKIGDRAIQGAVERACRAPGLGNAFEEVDHDGRVVSLGNVALNYVDYHKGAPRSETGPIIRMAIPRVMEL